MLILLKPSTDEFRTGWHVESVISASLPIAPLLALTPPPPSFVGLVAVVVATYIIWGQFAKHPFYRHYEPLRYHRAVTRLLPACGL